MKRQNIIISLATFLVVVAVIWMLTQRKPSTPTEPTSEATSKPQATPVSTPSATSFAGSLPDTMPKGPYQGMNDSRWPIYWKKREQDQTFEWKTPIQFYGKVLDQDGNPVGGATADVIWTDMSANGNSHMNVASNGDGLFSITGIRGKHMTVQVTKEGYQRQLTGTQSAFEYAGFWEPTYHEPDPNHPVIFRLRKKEEAEPMIRYGPTLFGAPNNGIPASFDLVTGRKAAGGSGNITLRITKGPKMNKRFDWTATVEGAGGAGLIESTDEFMVTAPEEGYQSQWTFSQKATDEKYQSQIQSKFYVKTGDSRYARVEMRIIPEYNETAAVDLTVYLNPKPGSRNLEFDPSKLLNSDTSRVKSP